MDDAGHYVQILFTYEEKKSLEVMYASIFCCNQISERSSQTESIYVQNQCPSEL